ncbi:TIGR03619 family F420-dependent LLM class oxidoreductase [Nocardioides sp. JQ2195]|uniref:TIGR03619 family F420-dependent LLM class oxidoreductase n=1 Tax=Nocardioides sp. JQ2195 TaxID=2592334 RepID=UPI00143E2C71|nr:TIGR03619 family F420-dependent LLM class oxidoreductase [Nocardioides sp. JQ2195]QIX26529.1 TIGR03619 family F420-dependent LLM class oxidoreductase [Nocardioides sp. JQ2195]
MARDLERAGFESAWVGDHIAMPLTTTSRHPSSAGRPRAQRASGAPQDLPWSPTEPWADSVVALATMAEATSTIRVGTGVMVAALRNPVILAKQIATIDVLSGGRVELGVGAGWLTEEFDIVGVNVHDRGRRLDELLTVVKRCWEGSPEAFSGKWYSLPSGAQFHPVPTRSVPILIGGASPRAYERVLRCGTGWIGTASVANLREGALDPIARIKALARERGREPDSLDYVVRVNLAGAPLDSLTRVLPTLAEGGVTELVVEIPWSTDIDLDEWNDRLRE